MLREVADDVLRAFMAPVHAEVEQDLAVWRAVDSDPSGLTPLLLAVAHDDGSIVDLHQEARGNVALDLVVDRLQELAALEDVSTNHAAANR